MDGAQSRAGEHRHHRFGDHRHVEDDAIALADALSRDHPGDARHLVAQLAIGEGLLGVGEWRIVDQRRLLRAATLHVPVERVVAGVEFAALEPTIERRVRPVEHLVPALRPVDRRRLLRPESLGILERPRMQRTICVANSHDRHPLRFRPWLSPAPGPSQCGYVRPTRRVGLPRMRPRSLAALGMTPVVGSAHCADPHKIVIPSAARDLSPSQAKTSDTKRPCSCSTVSAHFWASASLAPEASR